MTKRCKHCNAEHELTEQNWYRHSNTRDGFRSWCKTCCKNRDKAHAATRAQKPPPDWRATCGRGHHSQSKRAAQDAEAAIEIERLRREHAPPCRTESAVFARRVDSTLNWTPEIEAMTEGRA